MIDLSRARLVPYKHQVIGVEKLIEHPYFFIQDEMGAGKTKQVIDAAQVLAEMGLIEHVIVVAPAAVRAVWFDSELGELAKHLWAHFPCTITEYHARVRTWNWFTNFEGQTFAPKLHWIITNYDFIRRVDRLRSILKLANNKTLLVLDESSAVKSWKAKQTAACEELRNHCARVVELNGTPISQGPGDLYSQAHILNPAILGFKSFYHFRSYHAILGGFKNKQIIGWRGIEEIQKKLAPYVIRRLKKDCIDLPDKLASVPRMVFLDPPTWKIYKQMRDDMVAWLTDSTVSSATMAMVKAIRLAQITSGFVGGIEEQLLDTQEDLDFVSEDVGGEVVQYEKQESVPVAPLQPIGREKIDDFLDFLGEQLDIDPNVKMLVWCRFRFEVQRLHDEIKARFPQIEIGLIWGGQKREERDFALRLLDPRTMPIGPAIDIGTPATGSMGLNLTGAHIVVYMSNDFSLKIRLQSEDRVHRPGQVHAVSYFDVVACGPEGQKTIDHLVVKALQNKQDLADFTTSAWVDALTDE